MSKTFRINFRNVSLALIALFFCLPLLALAQYNDIERASINPSGPQGNQDAISPALSADGRYVVFASAATNLVDNDSNKASDIFLYDRSDDSLTLVSHNSSNTVANGGSSSPAISSDGAFIAFTSAATDLVSGDTNNVDDIFVYRLSDGSISRVSLNTDSSEGDGDSSDPYLSSDGRYVVFVSAATNLVSADTNADLDVFIHDRNSSATSLVSLSSSSAIGNADSSQPVVSSDGRYVAFTSLATNLVVADGNEASDVFLRDRTASTTVRVSIRDNGFEADGASSEPHMSSDGRYVVFQSAATNIVSTDDNGFTDVFLIDTSDDSVEIISLALDGTSTDGSSAIPTVSDTARHVAFTSSASNIVNNDDNGVSDTFVRDRTNSENSRVSVKTSGSELTQRSNSAYLAANAQYLAFVTAGTPLSKGDTNSALDVYVINIECLVDLGSAPSTDTDSDGTVNCSETCGIDPAKTDPGTCGCGIADVDSDGDGALDCEEDCDIDASKTEAGVCGCGVSDSDTNGNGVADCVDPTVSTTPRDICTTRRTRKRVVLRFPGDFTGVTYNYIIRSNKKVYRTGTSKRVVKSLRNFKPGKYRVRYSVTLADVTTFYSKWKTFRVK